MRIGSAEAIGRQQWPPLCARQEVFDGVGDVAERVVLIDRPKELAIAERLEARQRACVDHGRVALHLPLTTCCSENLSAQGVRQFYGSELPLVQSRGLRAECLTVSQRKGGAHQG